MRVMNHIMDDKERISCVNLISIFENNEGSSVLDEEVEQLVIIDDKGESGQDMDSIPVIKKFYNGIHHESTRKIKGKVKRKIKPIPGYNMSFCHFTKEQSKEICVDSTTGDWVKVEDVPEKRKQGIHNDENYTEFFKSKNNMVTV